MTAGYKSLAAGNFTQTRGGKRVYDLNQDAEGQKHLGESRNFEAYKRAMATGTDAKNIKRREDHEKAHIAKGKGEVWDTKLTNHSEKALRNAIENDRGLRKASVDAIVDSGLAENSKKAVEAKGAVALKQVIANSELLKKQVVDTHALNKKAESYEAIVQKEAEANWDNLGRTNASVQKLRLRETISSSLAEDAEAQYKTLIENVMSKGSNVPDVAPESVQLADSIQAAVRNVRTHSEAQKSAQIVASRNFAEALKNSSELRQQAAGIDDVDGENRVLAAAKTAVTKELIEATDNFQNTLPLPISSNNQKLGELFSSTDSLTQRVAYGRLLAKNGPGVSILRQQLSKLTKTMDANDPYLLDLKEILAADNTFKTAGRDFEVWGNNEPDPETGEIFANFDAATNSVKTWNDISATRFASMSKPSQMHTLHLLQSQDKPNLQELVERIMRSTARDNVKGVPDKALKRLAEDINADISDLAGRPADDDE